MSTPPSQCQNILSARQPSAVTIAGDATHHRDSAGNFIVPSGVAVGPNSDIIVADAAAQRIRIIRSGHVSTLAGTGSPIGGGRFVRGGFVDGPTSQAEFNAPSAVAVSSTGDVYVADTNNNAVRLIHQGVVSTLIGGPKKSGPDVGEASTVTAGKVFAVAVDAKGDVFFGNGRGLRVLDRTGKVTLFHNEVKQVYGVAVFDSGDRQSIFEVTSFGIDYYGLDGSERHIWANNTLGAHESNIAAGDLIGHPVAITAINSVVAAVTDLQDGTIYIVNAREGNIVAVAGSRIQTQSGDGSFERDGSLATARFNQPWGIAYDRRTRTLVVADAGAHTIRALGPFYFRGPGFDDTDLIQRSKNTYAIALLSNSQGFFHTDFASSIEGQLERRLTLATGKCVFVEPVGLGSDLRNYSSYVSAYAAVYNAMILFLNGTHLEYTFNQEPSSKAPYDRSGLEASAATWGPQFIALLRGMEAASQSSGTKMFVASHPYAYDVSANEFLWNRIFISYGTPSLEPSSSFYSVFSREIRAAKMPYFDLYDDFSRATKAGSCAIFGPANEHLSECGRALVADRLAKELLNSHALTQH